MIGIDVGSTAVTASTTDGVHRHHHDAPQELVCRVGDDVPCVLLSDDGFELRQAHEVFADAVRDTVSAFRRDRDPQEAPAAVAVPGWWTPRALGWVGQALESHGLGDVLLVNDGEAAVLGHRAAGGEVPGTVAVISLGAELSSVVIVEQCATAPRAVRSPALVHVEGGGRLDGAVLNHLVAGLQSLGVELDRTDAETVEAARVVLDQCRQVREELSATAVESVRPSLPGAEVRLRLVRSELEELAEPWADAVVRMTATALDQYPGEVESLLLVGGLAAMPLVSQRLSADLGLDVVVADDPTSTVARGVATRAVPVQLDVPPRRTWRRRNAVAALPAVHSAGRRRGRRRSDDAVAIDDNPAIAALTAGPAAEVDDTPGQAVGTARPSPEAVDEEPFGELPAGPSAGPPPPGPDTPPESLETLTPDESPASLPTGQHVATLTVPADVSEIEEAGGAPAGRRVARTASVR